MAEASKSNSRAFFIRGPQTTIQHQLLMGRRYCQTLTSSMKVLRPPSPAPLRLRMSLAAEWEPQPSCGCGVNILFGSNETHSGGLVIYLCRRGVVDPQTLFSPKLQTATTSKAPIASVCDPRTTSISILYIIL